MTTSEWISVASNVVAILAAPVVALWIGGKLQRRGEARNAKLQLFGTLISLRHHSLSADSVRALNLIDAVFADDPDVREAWTRFLATLTDPSMNEGAGSGIREERKRDLLLAMVKALGLQGKISSADLLRTYLPTFVAEQTRVDFLERRYKTAWLEDELRKRGIVIPGILDEGPTVQSSAAGQPPATQPSAVNGSGAGAG